MRAERLGRREGSRSAEALERPRADQCACEEMYTDNNRTGVTETNICSSRCYTTAHFLLLLLLLFFVLPPGTYTERANGRMVRYLVNRLANQKLGLLAPLCRLFIF